MRRGPEHGRPRRSPRAIRADLDPARLARSRRAGGRLRLRAARVSAQAQRAADAPPQPGARPGRFVPRHARRRHGRRPFGQGRPRHRPPHRDAPDGRRGARDRCRSHRADRGRHRADAEPGTDRRQQRHHARRRRAAPGRGDGARGAARAGGRAAAAAGRRADACRRRGARCRRRAASPSPSWSANAASTSR